MELSALLFQDEYTSLYRARDIEITSICQRGDQITPGCLFICIQGTRYDSHILLRAAQAGGAAAALIEEGVRCEVPEGFPVFSVPSTRRAMALAYNRLHHSPASGMHLIAVTGTNGKTSTATMIYTILCAHGLRAAVIGTVACRSETKNYGKRGSEKKHAMTTPDPDVLYPMLAEMRRDGIEYVVMETSSHALALEKLAPLHFDVALFTNLSPEHLDFHGTMKNYLAAKARLFSQCDCGILNFDSEYAEELARAATCRVLRCGAVYHEQYNAEEIRMLGAAGVAYTYATPRVRMGVSLPIPGAFTVYNSLLALTCALQLGIPPLTAKEALQRMSGVPGRLERLPLPEGHPFSVFIDYAHTEAALRNLLTTVRQFRRGGERIVLVFGCGGDRDAGKRAPMGKTAEELADFIIITSDNSRTEEPTKIIHDILRGMHRPEKRRVIVNRRRAIHYAIHTAKENDIILLVGKGHEDYEFTESGEQPFHEKSIVWEALATPPTAKESYEDPT
ncbi:MAG: UDP-N-acetylmuramoyl-L-alanyl-D-glutamate--2,6-diaminopimelate ligase [Clostridia bacterium]|nr:UDP-N-acetylmuramoyl-L-alanyl-D-glutamate--2,6-diaminopimelate ligase [Clostridia bacterium]